MSHTHEESETDMAMTSASERDCTPERPRAELERDAHAVLFPAFDLPEGKSRLLDLLRRGTVAVIMGESRDEYTSRSMSSARRSKESSHTFMEVTGALRAKANGPILIAVDQEPWGIQRLHALVPAFPSGAALLKMTNDEIISAAGDLAKAARKLGVNAFLSPVLDRLCGENAWLEGRTLDADHAEIARIASCFVIGIQQAGVLAIAKHFPGFPRLDADPALHDTRVHAADWDVESLLPFQEVIDAGAAAVMIGPAIVTAVDPAEPASTSVVTVRKLREDLGFAGVVVSDDLDAPATLRGRSVESTGLASLMAGADLLLVAGGPDVGDIAEALVAAAASDPSVALRLSTAARRVRSMVLSATHGGQFL